MGGFLLWLLFSFYLFNFFHEVSFYNGRLNNYVIEAQLMPLHLPRKLEIQDTYFIFHWFFFWSRCFLHAFKNHDAQDPANRLIHERTARHIKRQRTSSKCQPGHMDTQVFIYKSATCSQRAETSPKFPTSFIKTAQNEKPKKTVQVYTRTHSKQKWKQRYLHFCSERVNQEYRFPWWCLKCFKRVLVVSNSKCSYCNNYLLRSQLECWKERQGNV